MLLKPYTNRVLLAVGALFAANGAALAAGPTALTVPWVSTNPVIAHDSVTGRSHRLKGTCTGCTTFSWNFGDGSAATSFTSVSDVYNLEATHTYTGTVGQTFTAR